MFVDGRLKLIDFNIARQLDADSSKLEPEEHAVGTISYMSPEAIRSHEVGRQSDVWSLGIILYQMVYGKTAFAHLPAQQRLFAIPDPNVPVVYPSSGHRLEDYSERTQGLLMDVMRRCLRRDPGLRATIP